MEILILGRDSVFYRHSDTSYFLPRKLPIPRFLLGIQNIISHYLLKQGGKISLQFYGNCLSQISTTPRFPGGNLNSNKIKPRECVTLSALTSGFSGGPGMQGFPAYLSDPSRFHEICILKFPRLLNLESLKKVQQPKF